MYGTIRNFREKENKKHSDFSVFHFTLCWDRVQLKYISYSQGRPAFRPLAERLAEIPFENTD